MVVANLLAGADMALAHAMLIETDPASQASLDSAPTEIVLVFSEAVTPVVLRLIDVEGRAIAQVDDVRGKNARLNIPLQSRIPDGQYVVSYRVMSADTHPIAGAFNFSVGMPGAVDGFEIQEQGFEPARVMVLANRLLQFISLLIAAGTGFFWVLVRPPGYTEFHLRKIATIAAVVAMAAYVLAIGVGGADMAGAGPGSLIDYSVWKLAAGTNLLDSAIVGISGAVILSIGWRIPHGAGRSGTLLMGGVVALTGLALTGHAGTATPQWLMTPSVALHLFPAAFWVAATMPLAWIVNSSPTPESALVLNRFSSRAAIALAVLIASGVCLAIVQVQSFSALFSTDYGAIFLLKLGLVVFLLALAAVNKYWFTPRIEQSDSSSVLHLRRTIYFEVVLMTGVLILTMLLTTTAPPRSTAIVASQDAYNVVPNEVDAPGGFTTTMTQQGYSLDVSVSPAKPGRGVLSVVVKNEEGVTFSPVAITASLSLPALDIEAIKISLEPQAGGEYYANLREIVIVGDWELRIDVLVDDFTQLIYRMRVPIDQ
jgi:copper transport protein